MTKEVMTANKAVAEAVRLAKPQVIPVYPITPQTTISEYLAQYVADEKIQGSDNTQYYIRRAGQFIYGKQNFFNGAIGIVPKKLDKYESTKDVPAFDVSSDVNVDWLYYYIARPEIYKPQEALCTGTGSKRFHVNNFYNLSLAIPKMDEQIKIKEYFVHLDNLITLHQCK